MDSPKYTMDVKLVGIQPTQMASDTGNAQARVGGDMQHQQGWYIYMDMQVM